MRSVSGPANARLASNSYAAFEWFVSHTILERTRVRGGNQFGWRQQ